MVKKHLKPETRDDDQMDQEALKRLQDTMKDQEKLKIDYFHNKNIEEIRKQRDCELDTLLNKEKRYQRSR